MMTRIAFDPEGAFLQSLTVLYVEDEPTIRDNLGAFLRRRVGRLLVAHNGADGLEQFRSSRPALVITDIQMPLLDGLSMVAEIRRLDAGVPVVVTTAFEQVEYLARAIDVGVDKFVTKPVETGRLAAAIAACVRRLRAEAALEGERRRELERLRAHEREALGLLAGGMAHDFNNLLQGILSAIDVAQPMAVPGSEQLHWLGVARDAALQASGLGRRLVTLSERSFARLRPAPLAPTLRRAITGALSGSRTELQFEVPDLFAVPQDEELLARAFTSFAQNAREAMGDAGGLSVAATARTLAPEEVPPLPAGSYVQVTFRDNGPGVDPAILPRIFDPYFSTKPRGTVRGMGLGLAMSRAILHQHGGVAWVSSSSGQGAVFEVLLPAATFDEGGTIHDPARA
jgi:signal transduction histidine kinase